MPTTSYPRYVGDYAGIFVHGLARRLVEQGHSVTVVAPHAADAPTHERMDGVEVRRFRYAWPDSQQKLAYGAGIPEALRSSWLARAQVPLLLAALTAATLRHSREVDLVHAHFTQTGAAGAIAKAAWRKPLVITAHGSDVFGEVAGRASGRIVRTIIRRADGVITVSEPLAASFRQPGFPPVSLIPNAADKALFTEDAGRRISQRIIYVGRMIEIKHHRELIEAMRLVVDNVAGASLVLIGDGPLAGDLKALATSLGLTEKVQFLGNRPSSEIPGLLRTAEVCAQVSRSNGFDLTLVEAMATGLPIVATDSPAKRLAIRHDDTGLFVPPGDPPALAAALVRVLNDKELRTRLGAHAREEAVSRFSWEVNIAATVETYRAAIARHRSGRWR